MLVACAGADHANARHGFPLGAQHRSSFFGVLGGDCFVHPSADLTAAFDALHAEGLSGILGRLKPLLAADAQFGNAASDVDMVNGAWNLERLAGVYDGFVGRYQPVLDELRADAAGDIDDESAFLLRILLIHDYRRLLLRDPELPNAFRQSACTRKRD
jgi:phenylacetic acid degradation operon negative regulatory protein